jgi:hypothetical protein
LLARLFDGYVLAGVAGFFNVWSLLILNTRPLYFAPFLRFFFAIIITKQMTFTHTTKTRLIRISKASYADKLRTPLRDRFARRQATQASYRHGFAGRSYGKIAGKVIDSLG